jgi:hypothetical protein
MKLTDYEITAWDEYQACLDKYNKTDNVKGYDRVSVHEAFPEIAAAFEHVLAMRTYRLIEAAGSNVGNDPDMEYND